MTAPELSRPIRVETIGDEPQTLSISAKPAERHALARRFGVESIGSLTAQIEIRRDGEEVRAEGKLHAQVVQTCVASAEPVPATVEEAFSLRFRPSPQASGEEEEIELAATDLDVDEYEGGTIDFGEAVAETLAVSLDPYPRAPDAAETLKAAGVISEEEAGPFAALAQLKKSLGGDEG